MTAIIADNATVLFQGDSITDWHRSRDNDADLGLGYVAMIDAWFTALHPEKNVRFLNRGVGCNRVVDLKNRWQEDCIDLDPDWVSILIGINDTWITVEGGEMTTTESFTADYHTILTQVREQTAARLILCEAFVLPFPADREAWRVDLDPRIHATRALAREFDAILIPFDGVFAAASMHRPPEFWAYDGVHPTPAGFALMAQTWLSAIGADV